MWSEFLPYAAPGGATAIAAGAVWMVLTSRLIPAAQHRRVLDELDRTKAALDKVEKQRDDLLQLAYVTVGIVQALPKAAPATVIPAPPLTAAARDTVS